MRTLWVVRSRRKLFTGLAFAIGGFLLFYTVLTLLVLEPEIPWRRWPWPSAVLPSASKFGLLVLPVVSLVFSVMLHLAARRLCCGAAPKARRTAWSALLTGENFLLALLLFFWQMERLSCAKGLTGFSPLMPPLILLALAVYTGYAIRKLILAGKGERV